MASGTLHPKSADWGLWDTTVTRGQADWGERVLWANAQGWESTGLPALQGRALASPWPGVSTAKPAPPSPDCPSPPQPCTSEGCCRPWGSLRTGTVRADPDPRPRTLPSQQLLASGDILQDRETEACGGAGAVHCPMK